MLEPSHSLIFYTKRYRRDIGGKTLKIERVQLPLTHSCSGDKQFQFLWAEMSPNLQPEF